MKSLLLILLVSSSLTLASFAGSITCGNANTEASLSLDLRTMNGALQISNPKLGSPDKLYKLQFEAVASEHEPPSCTNPGPFLQYQTINAARGVQVKILLYGGFAITHEAEIIVPEIATPIELYCSYPSRE